MKDGGYIHHLILCKGFLFKRNTSTAGGGSLQYRRRYFELSNIALTYSQNEKKVGVSACHLEKSCGYRCINTVEPLIMDTPNKGHN